MRTLQHRKIRRAVEVYLDGEADSVLAAEIQRHLRDCWSCSQDGEWLLLIKASLRRIEARRPVDLAVARLNRYATRMMKEDSTGATPS